MKPDRLTNRQIEREREAVVRLYAKLGVLAEVWLTAHYANSASCQRWLRTLYEDVIDAAYEVGLVFGYPKPAEGDSNLASCDPWVLWERLLGYDWPHTAEEYAAGWKDLIVLGRVLGITEKAA